MKKFEKLKRDFDKLQLDGSVMAKERNDAVAKLSQHMQARL